MATFQADGTITRAAPLTDTSTLDINETNGYYIQRDGFGPGEVSFRREDIKSPYMRGTYNVHAVKDQMTSTLRIRVDGGGTVSQTISRLETLVEAFEQWQYTLTINIGGVSWQYVCDAADYAVGNNGSLEDLWLRSHMQMVTFQIPHRPPQFGTSSSIGE